MFRFKGFNRKSLWYKVLSGIFNMIRNGIIVYIILYMLGKFVFVFIIMKYSYNC